MTSPKMIYVNTSLTSQLVNPTHDLGTVNQILIFSAPKDQGT